MATDPTISGLFKTSKTIPMPKLRFLTSTAFRFLPQQIIKTIGTEAIKMANYCPMERIITSSISPKTIATIKAQSYF
jgi:hypothetical protein